MRRVLHAAAVAAGPVCLFATMAISAPTFAESPARLNMTAVTYAIPPSSADVADDGDDNSYTVPAIRDEAGPDAGVAPQASAPAETTLAALVDARESSETRDAEHECLAISVYFESKGEPLAGQLAVAQTLINRAQSGRFPSSLCGVMHQRGQFSFVHGAAMPAVPRDSTAWREAVAIASVAIDDAWRDTAPGALFFHAASVSPNWRLTRIARLGNHIFYR